MLCSSARSLYHTILCAVNRRTYCVTLAIACSPCSPVRKKRPALQGEQGTRYRRRTRDYGAVIPRSSLNLLHLIVDTNCCPPDVLVDFNWRISGVVSVVIQISTAP